MSLFAMTDMIAEIDAVPPLPRWTKANQRDWDAAMRFMRQHPELFEPADDPRDYLPYWEETPHYYMQSDGQLVRNG